MSHSQENGRPFVFSLFDCWDVNSLVWFEIHKDFKLLTYVSLRLVFL